MARSNSKVRSSAKVSLDAKWLNNAMKSIGAASAATFKSIAPNISSAGSGTATVVKSAATAVKSKTASQVAKQLSQNKYVQLAKTTLEQSKKDIKSGNLYNPDRAAEKMMGSSFDDFNFDDFDDSEASVTFNFIDDGGSENAANASVMISDAIASGTQAQLQASKATIDAMIGVSSAAISQIQQGFGETNQRLTNIDNTLSAILQYHEENTTNYYQAALAAFERIGGALETDYSSSSSNPMDVFTSSGGLNGREYKSYVKKRLKRVVDQSPVGMLLPFLEDDKMLEVFMSDPVGGITQGLIGGMIPKVVEGTLKEVDKTFGELIPNMLVSMSNWENDKNSSKVKKMLGKIFGVNIETRDNLNMREVDKNAATFDNMTRNALVEVLPKYARESTAYLREIAMHVTKKGDDKLLANSQIFDAKTNSYKTRDELTKELAASMEDAIKSAFTSSDFGRALEGIGSQMGEKDRANYEKTLMQFFTQLAQEKSGLTVKDYDLSNKDARIHSILQRVDGKKSKTILTEAIRRLYDSEVAIGSAARAQQNAKNAWNSQLDDISANYDAYNVLALGLNNETSFGDFMDQYQGNKANAKLKKERLQEEKRQAAELEKSSKGKRRSGKEIALAGIADWVDMDEYSKRRDLEDHGKISASLFGEDFGQGFKQMGNHAKNGMFSVMKCDTKGAMREFSSIFTDQIGKMWEGTKKNFFEPLANRLFGKDEDGKGIGLFANTRNKLDDTYKAFIQRINGKSYKDSNGNLIELDSDKESLVDKATGIFTELKNSVTMTLFGSHKKKEGSDKEKTKGMLTNLTESFKQGLQGWKEAIFGESDNPEENAKVDKEKIKKAMLDHAPDAIIGTAGGALFGALTGGAGGSLLGTLIGGPVGGAVLGFAGSFLAKSNKFKDYLFGPEIEDPDGTKRRIGGLISENTQNFFKKNKNTIIGSAAVGAMKSMIFPSSTGLMSTLVGGPIAGAAMGVGISLLKESTMFQEFLYGNEETGKRGIVNAFKDIFKGNTDQTKEADNSGVLKMLGMGAIGGVGGALTAGVIGKVGLLGAMAMPGGPLGGAILGAAIGIAGSGNKFSKWLFGEKDPDTKERKGGLMQRLGNYMHVEVFAPMKSKILTMTDDIKTTIKFDILENIRLPFLAAADSIKASMATAKEFITDKVDKVSTFAVEKIIKPFGSHIDKLIVQPVKKVVGKATDILYNTTKFMVTLPFKVLGKVGKMMTSKIAKAGRAFRKFLFNGTAKLFGFAGSVIKGAFSPVAGLVKEAANGISAWRQNRKDKKAEKQDEKKGGFRAAYNRFRAGITSDEWRKDYYGTRAARLEEYAENKKKRSDREQLDYNRAQMARLLGYDAKYFTKANYEQAMKKAKEEGKKVRWRGAKDMQFEEDPAEKRRELLKKSTAQIAKDGEKSDDVNIRQLSEQYRTNEILREIAEQNGISIERAEELYEELAEERKKDAEIAGYEYDEETGTFQKASGSGKFKSKVNEYMEQISQAGGIKGYLKNEVANIKDFWNIKKGYENSELKGIVDDGRESVKSLFSRFGKARAEGGVARKGETLLVGDGGSDLSSAELFVPKSDGKIISQKDGGIKVHIASIAKDVFGSMKKFIPFIGGRNEEDSTKVGSYSKLKAAAEAEEHKDNQVELSRQMLSTLQDIRDNNDTHHNIWSSIFSKKGLIGMGLMALIPTLIKNLPTIIDSLKGVGDFIGWFSSGDHNTNGQSPLERVSEIMGDGGEILQNLKDGDTGSAVKNFILDDGQYDANSGGKAAFLANSGRVVTNGVKTVVSGVKNAYNSGKELVSTLMGKGKTAASEATENVAKKVATESAEATIKETAEKGAPKVISVIDDFLKAVAEKIAKKFPSVGDDILAKVMKGDVMTKVYKCISKHFGKISAKIAAVSSFKVSIGSLTLGASELVFITSGALNGLTGAAKLFQVDQEHVDGIMTLISGAFGAFLTGTLPGSIVDIVCGLVAEILGFDFLNFVACAFYGLLAGKENVDALESAREEFRASHDAYIADEVESQYNAQKASGIISSDVTLEQFKQGVSDGTYKVNYKSFNDYNAEQHQSLGYKMGNFFTKAGSNIKNFFTGKNSYTDANGQTYADNGDGTYTVYSASGKNLGKVSSEAVDVSTMSETTTGGVKGALNKAGEIFKNTTEKVKEEVGDVKSFVDRLLTYTDPKKSMDTFDSEVIGGGGLVSTLISPMLRGIFKAYVTFKRTLNDIGNWAGDKLDGVKDFFGNIGTSIKNAFTGGGSGKGIGGHGTGDTENGFAYYSQDDPRWRDNAYVGFQNDGATMGDSGCGPTAMAMVASQARNGGISPTQMANMASASGFRDNTGTNEGFISYAGDTLGLSHTDVMNPSGDFIRNSVSMGNPVVLNGVSNSTNSAFTPSGHYVVAVGTDKNGNVLINDPRGKQYSTSYSPEQLASQTRKAWSFGGNGFKPLRYIKNKFGGRGLSGDWLSIVKSVKALIAAQKPKYDQSGWITINYKGTDLKVRTDCSGFVGACLKLYGAIPMNQNITSRSLLQDGNIGSGFTYGGWNGWDNLKEGDIITRNGHVEIFSHNSSGVHYVYNCGSTSSLGSPSPTPTGHKNGYTVVWRPGNAGTGANVVSVDASATSSTASSGTSQTSSSNSLTDIIGKVGGVFSKFASKAMTGILTGNWDYNFSDTPTTTDTGSTSGTSTATVDTSGIKISGNNTSEKLYNALIQSGATPAGASGVLGNIEAESGIRTNNVQNSTEKRVGNDKEYTAKVDNGSYTNFANDSAGYGLAQWTSSDRKAGLLNLAKSKGLSIADEKVQIPYLISELNGAYNKSVMSVLRKTNSVQEASDVVLTKFERPADQSSAVKAKRAGYAQKYYDMYANRSATGGYGVARNSKSTAQRMYGGRGPMDDVSVSSTQTRATSSVSDRINRDSVNTVSLENLLSTAIKVLQSIDSNTSKIEGLQSSISSVNNGGNVIVSNSGNTSNVTEAVEASRPKTSVNADLAMRIAKGF